MGNYAAEPIEHVRVAVIGLSERGNPMTCHLAEVPHCEVVALCDLQEEVATEMADKLCEKTGRRPQVFAGSKDSYRHMLGEVKPDAVFIFTSWETHAPMAVDCMEAGAHAFVEVPLALTLKGLWSVVDASERTRRHCMMMENVNYGREELMFLNIVRRGLLGPLLHAEAAYLHDLRHQMPSGEIDYGCNWRSGHFIFRNGNLYPTHGLGPISQYMNILRTEDTFERIVSLSSPSIGRSFHAAQNSGEDTPADLPSFSCGDVNTSIIRTRAGRTITLTWDETTPRPYSRRNLIQGCRGVLAGFPNRVAGEWLSDVPELLEGQPEDDRQKLMSGEKWFSGEGAESALFEAFDHPLYKRLGCPQAKRGGIDIIMLNRIIECLHGGLPMDQNVYEGALWSSVAPLSEKSVNEDGMPQLFPDFTRGDWQTTPPLPIIQ